jgi:hypothetical protein
LIGVNTEAPPDFLLYCRNANLTKGGAYECLVRDKQGHRN